MTSHVGVDFFGVFAVFFPAVTGIMAGANMSGDLREPSKAIPKGTLTGIAISFWTYIGLVWMVGSSSVKCAGSIACNASNFGTQAWVDQLGTLFPEPEGGLIFNKLIMTTVSLWGPLVYGGVFAATLSSALASLVGAPRILQALSKDDIFPFKAVRFWAQDDKLFLVPLNQRKPSDSKEPIRAYFLTYLVAMACILIGIVA